MSFIRSALALSLFVSLACAAIGAQALGVPSTTPVAASPAPSDQARASTPAPAPRDDSQSVQLIAFGSCARERKPQPIWSQIISAKPDLFLMIGDNHYADVWEKDGKMGMRPVEKIERIDEAYAALAAVPGFTELRSQCPMMATWDDHDYGANDAGKDFPLREQSKQVFLKFWGLGDDSAMREQPGVYHARTFGPQGQRVQVIMLDTRFNRDAITRLPREQRIEGRGPYAPITDKTKTMLGEAQW
ncbi:MAG: alkaline phosphatase family protein, partial [Phycisphaerales bacterium]|nr:alkaline phosphatase family protein [Phycisphaerales bacterium]